MPADVEFIVADARIDLKQWNKSIAQMESDAKAIEQILGGKSTKGVEVAIDDSEAKTFKSLLEDIDSTYTAKVDATVEDQKIKNVDSMLNDIDAGVTAEIDATNTEALQKLEAVAGKIDDLKRLAKLQLIFEVPNIIEGLGGTIQDLPILSNITEMDTALGTLEATTGRLVPGAEKLIVDLYTNAWGDSVTAIGKVIAKGEQLGISQGELKTAVESAFTVEALGIADAEDALTRMDIMVKNDLAPSYEAAADIIITGFQTGADKGGDLLDTFGEYGSTFQTLGIDGEAALGFINSGLEAGIDNSDRIADALRETGIRLSEMGTNEDIKAAFEQLDSLSDIDLAGMWEGFQAGDIDGGEFYTAFFQALEDAATKDKAQAKTLAATLVGTIAEDFGIEAVSQLSGAWDPAWGAIAGRSEKAALAVNNNLGTAIEELTRTIETDLVSSLNEALNLDQLVDDAKAAIQRLAAALREGKGFGEALEIALEMPGLADKISQLESALANFVIDFLAGIASIGEALGQDMSGLRDTVAGFAGGQVGFDIQTAQTEEEVAAAIQRAVERGASSADISAAIQTGFGEVLTSGDVVKAQALLDAISNLPQSELGQLSKGVLEAVEMDIDQAIRVLERTKEIRTEEMGGAIAIAASPAAIVEIQRIDDAIAELQTRLVNVDTETMRGEVGMMLSDMNTQLATAVETGDFTGASAIAQQLLDVNAPGFQEQMSQFTTDLMFAFDEALAAGDVEQAASILDFLGLSEEANTTAFSAMEQQLANFDIEATDTMDNVSSSTQNLGDTIENVMGQAIPRIDGLWGAILSKSSDTALGKLENFIENFEGLTNVIKDALDAISDAEKIIGSDVTGARVGGIRGEGVTMVGEAGRELIFSDERFAVLNNQTTERLYTALSNMAGGVGSNTQNNRTVNYNPTIIVQNDAQAALFGGHTLDQLRGNAF